jgi:predicted nucleic acid-binding protein
VKVVSDTSPICYLILIDEFDLLASLFGSVLIPPAVESELLHPWAPAKVRQRISQRPAWLQVTRFPPNPKRLLLSGLHLGERDAILLADSIAADLVILDERKARRAALRQGHRIVGLIGLLVRGAECGLLDLDQAIERLAATNFRLDPSLIELFRGRFP